MSVIDQVSLSDQIAEVKREIDMRKRVYIRLIDSGKMTAVEAEHRTLAMCAVLQTLEKLSARGGSPLPHYPTIDSESANAAPDPKVSTLGA